MRISRLAKVALWTVMGFGFSFIYVPLILVVINSFNQNTSFAWPPSGFTTSWWSKAANNEGVRDAITRSALVAVFATMIALVLGALAAAAVARYEFFGRDTVSLLFVLPIALPGIVTGIALNNVFTNFLGQLTLFTIVVGHATFCIVVVFNNVAARYRRLGKNLEEASMDLGATRWTTFRLVTFPFIRTSLIAGGLLSLGLSFDEIIVTTFTAGAGQNTLPIWIFQNLFRPNQAPIVNVVAATLVILSIIPIYFSQRLASDDGTRKRS
jgi:putative spermidine/putrescine transport system permease protein